MNEIILTGQSELLASGSDPWLFIQKLFFAVLNAVPFEEFFGAFLDTSGTFLGAIFTTLKGVITGTPALFKEYASDIPRGVALLSVSGLFSYILTRITYIFKKFGGFFLGLACDLLNPMLTLASYTVSVCVFSFLEVRLRVGSLYTYIILTVVAFIIHALLLGYSKRAERWRMLKAFEILGISIVMSYLRAAIMFVLCTQLPGLYSPLTVADSMGAIVVVSLLFYLLMFVELRLIPDILYFIKCLFIKKAV